jgi:hypothetical protein
VAAYIIHTTPPHHPSLAPSIRLVLVEVSWFSFQHIYIFETVQKSFIPIKLFLLAWNFYHLSLHLYSVMSAYLMTYEIPWNLHRLALPCKSPCMHALMHVSCMRVSSLHACLTVLCTHTSNHWLFLAPPIFPIRHAFPRSSTPSSSHSQVTS